MASTAIAAQLFTIREFARTPADIATSMKKLADIGFGAVQVSGIGKIEPTELKKILDDNQLNCCVTHTHWGALTEGLDEEIERHKVLDCKYTAIGSMPPDLRTPEGIPTFIEGMAKAVEAMTAEGIRLGYHNHSFEFTKVDGKLLMDQIFDNMSEDFWAEIDTYWVQHGGGDPAAWIRKFAGRIPVVHFKDFSILEGKQTMFPIGEGNLNWDSIVPACRDAGVEYYAIEQDRCNGLDPFDCLATSLKNMQAMGLE